MTEKPTYEELEKRIQELEQRKFERNRATKALIKSENLYKEAQSLAHIGYWDYEPYENTLFWSDELYSIFEIDKSAGPLAVEDFLNRIHPEDRDNIKEQVEKKKGYRSDYRIVMENGSVKHMHERVQIIRQEDGKVVLMKGTAQNITERKKAENALRESEQKLSTHLQNTPIGAISWDLNFKPSK